MDAKDVDSVQTGDGSVTQRHLQHEIEPLFVAIRYSKVAFRLHPAGLRLLLSLQLFICLVILR